jgi:hypothetical protein
MLLGQVLERWSSQAARRDAAGNPGRFKSGKSTLRHGGTLYSIGIGRTHARARVIVLVQDLDIRIIDAATGELLRELVLDTTQRYQGTGRPPGPTR